MLKQELKSSKKHDEDFSILKEKQEVNEKIIEKFEKEIVKAKMQKQEEIDILNEQISQTKSVLI